VSDPQLVGLDPNKNVLDKDGFSKIVADVTGLSENGVTWKTDPDPFIGDQDRARVVLDLFSMTGLGWEERRRRYNVPGYPANALVTILLGNRTLIITVRAEAFDKSVEAAELIDKLRSATLADDTIEDLNALNLAFVSASAATRVSYVVDERVVNAAIADFTFAGVAQHVAGIAVDDRVPARGTEPTWIETVNDNNEIPGELSI
jgi:hypothetical protein